MTSDVILKLENIASAYGKIDAVKGINLEVEILIEGRNTSIANEHWFSVVIKTRATVIESRISCKNGL